MNAKLHKYISASLLLLFLSFPNLSNADLDPKAKAEAKLLGVRLDSTLVPNHIEIFRYKGNFPTFISVGAYAEKAQGDGNYVHIVYFKSAAGVKGFKAFKLGRNVTFHFSPLGKFVFVTDNFLAGNTDTYVYPVESFEKATAGAPRHLFSDAYADSVKLEHFEISESDRTTFSDIISTKLGFMKTCSHAAYIGTKWLDEDRIGVEISGSYCGEEDESGDWTGVINLKTKKIDALLKKP